MLHGFVSLFGESHAARLPFWAIHVATNLPLYGLTKRLFGRDAALWAIFAFNASAYFITMPDGYIMPDPPLLLALAVAVWLIVEILFAPDLGERRKTLLWLAVGVAFGLAGLAKYSAALVPLGLLGFFLFSSAHRRWLADFRPYAAAALALILFSPALIWNAQHGWVSLAFQSDRAAGALRLDAGAATGVLEALLGQIASLSPWIAIPVVAGLYRGLRSRDPNGGARLLLWLALPPLLLFALLPLVGQRAIPHWFNSGWLFAYPLAGAWLARSRDAPPDALGEGRRDIVGAHAGAVRPAGRLGSGALSTRPAAARSDHRQLRLACPLDDAKLEPRRQAPGFRAWSKAGGSAAASAWRSGPIRRSAAWGPARAASPSPATPPLYRAATR